MHSGDQAGIAQSRGAAFEDDSSKALGLGYHAQKVQVRGPVDADIQYDVEGSGEGSGGIDRFFAEQVETAREKLHAEQRRQSIIARRQKYLSRHPDIIKRDPLLDQYLTVKNEARAIELAEELATADIDHGLDLIPFENLETVNRSAYTWIERRTADLHAGGRGLCLIEALAVARDEADSGVTIEERCGLGDTNVAELFYLYGDEPGPHTIESLMRASVDPQGRGSRNGKRMHPPPKAEARNEKVQRRYNEAEASASVQCERRMPDAA